VIEDSNVDEGEGLLEAAGYGFVGVGGFGDPAARVVVREDDRGGVVLEGLFDDLAGMYGGAVDGAAEELLAGYQAMAAVEVDERENFVRMMCQSGRQVVSGRSRRGQCRAAVKLAGSGLACADQYLLEGRFSVAGAGVCIGGVKGHAAHVNLRLVPGGLPVKAERHAAAQPSRLAPSAARLVE
jgi:hypothetical protein